MLDPSQVLLQILTNITSKVQPPRPQLPSLFDYFMKNHSGDLIQPVVIKKWTENHTNTQMTSTDSNSESPYTKEEFYSIPSSFFEKVAIEVFESLSDAERLQIQEANQKAYNDMVIEYKDKMKKLYEVKGSLVGGENGALQMVAGVLQPIMAALEALTDVHMIGWAGGSAANGVGIIKISSQCSDPTEPPMIFPRSQTDILRHAAQEWMTKVGGQVIEQWVGGPYTSTEQSIAHIVPKRKSPGDDIRLIKRTRTATVDSTNGATRHSFESSSLSPQSRPEMTRSSINTALQASLLEGQTIESQNFIVRQIPMTGSLVFPEPEKTPQRAVLVPQQISRHQNMDLSLDTYMRHRSESLPPIRTLNQDESSTAHRSQSASEGVTMSIQKQRNGSITQADKEYQKYYSPLIATIPSSARNLLHGLNSITTVDLGLSYREIITMLIKIETLYGFKSIHKGVPHSLRPHEVTSWIMGGRGRKGGSVTVPDIDQFSKAWWKWWTDMQPKWREVDESGKPKQTTPIQAEDEDWKCLQKPGANGLISVVAGLHGWGVAIKKQTLPLGSGERRANWLCAVEDCHWVMERLIEALNKKQEECSEGCKSEEDELEVETVEDDVDYMQGDTAYRP